MRINSVKRPVFSLDYSISGWVICLSVFVTGFAYHAYFTGLTIAGAGNGSLVFFFKPVLASVPAILFLGERVNAFAFAVVILIRGCRLRDRY